MDEEGDLSLLRTITESLGRAVWLKTIVVMTHGASAIVADGPDGVPFTFHMFITQRLNVMQQQIHQAAGAMELENPVVLVENHSALTHVLENYSAYAGKRDLVNAQVWKAELLLLCLSSKILTEARAHIARPNLFSPLSYIISSLLDWRAQVEGSLIILVSLEMVNLLRFDVGWHTGGHINQ